MGDLIGSVDIQDQLVVRGNIDDIGGCELMMFAA